MLKIFLFALVALVCYTAGAPSTMEDEVKHWALLVAGSSGWYNYRHQADICHAYQVLHAHGIPDDNIVVMMYDDIANNEQNPDKGVIINHPNGHNVYPGVPKDYNGDDVTPKNFLSILQGDKAAMQGIGSGKVIASGPNDNVFVYFADHGATDLVAFPTSTLSEKELKDALTKMAAEKKFKKLVFYLEACESGSMFDSYKIDNVFTTTASGPDESSYACYYDEKLDTYLGDVYSVKWMENSDVADFNVETLLKQFGIVKAETNTSKVHKYGDMSFDKDTLGQYQGEGAEVKSAEKAAKLTEAPGSFLWSSIQSPFTVGSTHWLGTAPIHPTGRYIPEARPLKTKVADISSSKPQESSTTSASSKDRFLDRWTRTHPKNC